MVLANPTHNDTAAQLLPQAPRSRRHVPFVIIRSAALFQMHAHAATSPLRSFIPNFCTHSHDITILLLFQMHAHAATSPSRSFIPNFCTHSHDITLLLLFQMHAHSYDSLSVDDMYLLYSQLKLEDNSIFTCVGTSGEFSFSFFSFSSSFSSRVLCFGSNIDYAESFATPPTAACKLGGGRSGSLVLRTMDSKFIVKMIPREERDMLLKLLPA